MKNNNTLKSIVFDSKTMTPTTNNIPPQGYKMTELGALPEEWEVESERKIFNFESKNFWRGITCF